LFPFKNAPAEHVQEAPVHDAKGAQVLHEVLPAVGLLVPAGQATHELAAFNSNPAAHCQFADVHTAFVGQATHASFPIQDLYDDPVHEEHGDPVCPDAHKQSLAKEDCSDNVTVFCPQ
jgi:hypothetical protein